MSSLNIPGFYLLQTPGDGHCLLHSIIGSWSNQITNPKPPTLETIKCHVYIESINNLTKYLAFFPQISKFAYIKQLKDYIIHKKYDSAFGDTVPMIIANSLSISIKILNVQVDGSLHDIQIVPDSSESKFEISIHRKVDHFSALKLVLSQPSFRNQNSWQTTEGIHRQQPRPMDTHPTCLLSAHQPISGSGDSHRQQPRPVDPNWSQRLTDPSTPLSRTMNAHLQAQSSPDLSDIHRQQSRPMEVNSGQTTTNNITYTTDQLRNLRPTASSIPRNVRKTIFECGIWRPKSGPHRQQSWPMCSTGPSLSDTRDCNRDQLNSSDHHHDLNRSDTDSSSRSTLLKSLPRSNVFQRRNHKFHLALVNARSIRNKTQDLLHHSITKDLDACVVTETWLNKDDSPTVAALQTGGYDFQHVPRSKPNRGGGLGILYKEGVKVTKIKSANFPTFEMCLWKIYVKHTEFVLVAIYRPPYSAKHKKTVPMFINEFSDVLTDILATCNNDRLIIVGDFNIHTENSNDSDARAFNDALSNFDCVQHVKCQTHEAGHTIDLCITPASSSLHVTSPTTDCYFSDHAIIEFLLSIPKPPITKIKTQSRSLSKINTQLFKDDLVSVMSDILKLEDHHMALEYNNRLTALLNKHAPLITKSSVVRPRVAWFDSEAKDLKRKTRNHLHKWIRSKDPLDHTRYKLARNAYRQHLDDNKRQHFTDAIQAANGDPKKLFSITLNLMGKIVDNPLPSCNSDVELAEDFASFFINKIECIRTALVSNPPYTPSANIATEFPSFEPLSDASVAKIIRNSKPTTCLLDPLPTKLVKEYSHIFTPVITKIVNNSLSSAQFYNEWKTAVVIPLLKKHGLETVKPNYRPVSNLSFISKIAEKGVISQLNSHFTSNNLHSSHQSAYKQDFSTETALCVLVNDLLWALERSEVSILVALDLSAAFDTVDHNILCSVLHNNFGIRESALEWFRSYLKNRQLKVKIRDSTSDLHTFNYSVPQGSCLGPVLFNAYVSTITDCIPQGLSLGGYADDHFIKGNFDPNDIEDTTACITSIENTLLSVRDWMSANRLKLNPSKTEVIIFGSQQMLKKHTVSNINVAGDKIEVGSCIKYLGAYLDATLSFKDFISQKCRAAAISIRHIFQIRKFINTKIAKQLASALVLSHLDYSNSILCGLPANTIKPLQRIQNWAARVVLGQSKHDSAEAALKELHWLPIVERIDFKIACLVFKCIHKKAPSTLSSTLSFKSFQRSTRAATSSHRHLNEPKTSKKTFASRSFSVYGPELWNSLSPSLKAINDFKVFKKDLKTFLFRRAFI